MSRAVVLDAGPLGLATNPKRSPQSTACTHWLQAQLAAGARIIVPEIVDYEIRRELLRAEKRKGLEHLDALVRLVEYLPLTTAAMQLAAQLWAQARQKGQPTAADHSLDVDVILAAQALSLGDESVVIATTNVGHLSRFVAADLWTEIGT